MKHFYIASILLVCFSLKGFSQITDDDLKKVVTEINSQRSANSKDIITSLFRAGIDDLLGTDHKFDFSASLFGIDSMLRGKGVKLRNRNYSEERQLRQWAVTIGLTGDIGNVITKFSAGVTGNILNRKDITKKFKDTHTKRLEALSDIYDILHAKIIDFTKDSSAEVKIAVNQSWNAAMDSKNFSNLHSVLKKVIYSSEFKNSVLNSREVYSVLSTQEIEDIVEGLGAGRDEFELLFKKTITQYARKPLWTITPTMTYDRLRNQGAYSVETVFTAGLGKDITKKPCEIEAKAMFKLANDTLNKESNYEEKPFSFSLGINKILVENEEKESKMELKIFTKYDHQFGSLAQGKQVDLFTLNSTFRINVYKSLWLPITLNYDPKNGNLFGVFAITANIGN